MLQMCVRQIVRKLDYGFVQEGDLKKAGSKKKTVSNENLEKVQSWM